MGHVSLKNQARSAKQANAKAGKAAEATTEGSIYDGFQNLPLGLGLGTDNASSAHAYGYNPRSRNRQQIEWMHRSSWAAGVAIDVIADDMTRAGVELHGSIEPQLKTKIEAEATRLRIWPKINETSKAARMYGGAIAVLLVDGQDYALPFRADSIGLGQFRGLMVLDRWMLQPDLNDIITELGPETGLPRYYKVLSAAPGLRGMRIHHSRCIRLIGDRLPYWQALTENLWGMSVLERIWDRIVHFDAATLGAAQLVQKAYVRYLKLHEYRKTMASGGNGRAALENSVQRMRYASHNEGMVLLDSEDDVVTEQNSSFSGITDVVIHIAQQVTGGIGMPLVKFLGQSPAGLNSTGESDFRMYYDNILQLQERDYRDGVTTVYRCAAHSIGVDPGNDFSIQFRPLWQLDETAKADAAQKLTATILSAKADGTISQKTALEELHLSSKKTGIWTSITDEQIADADDEALPPMPPPVAMEEDDQAGDATGKALKKGDADESDDEA